MVRVLIIGLALISLSFVFTTSCQSSESSPPTTTPAQAAAAVIITDGFTGASFLPATITVAVGTTVTWTTNDVLDAHTVTSDSGLFDGSILVRDKDSPPMSGYTFSYTFTERGTFSYHCSDHPWMVGKVIVAE